MKKLPRNLQPVKKEQNTIKSVADTKSLEKVVKKTISKVQSKKQVKPVRAKKKARTKVKNSVDKVAKSTKRKSRPSLMSSIRRKLTRLKSKKRVKKEKKIIPAKVASKSKLLPEAQLKAKANTKRRLKTIVKKGIVLGDSNEMIVRNTARRAKPADGYTNLIESLKKNIKKAKAEENKTQSIDQDFDSLIHQIKNSLKNDEPKK